MVSSFVKGILIIQKRLKKIQSNLSQNFIYHIFKFPLRDLQIYYITIQKKVKLSFFSIFAIIMINISDIERRKNGF